MKKEKEPKDMTRNHRFAAAMDELKRNHGVKSQLDLAQRMGVNKDTITNCIKGYTPITEDIITKLQTASGCIFNLQWLRGESDVMLAADLQDTSKIASHDASAELIAVMRSHLADKDKTITALEGQVASKEDVIRMKDEVIAMLRQRISDLEAKGAGIEKGHSTNGLSLSERHEVGESQVRG